MANLGPSRKDLRRKRANYCRKSVKVAVADPADLSQVRRNRIRGHVFCSFLALVLRQELEVR